MAKATVTSPMIIDVHHQDEVLSDSYRELELDPEASMMLLQGWRGSYSAEGSRHSGGGGARWDFFAIGSTCDVYKCSMDKDSSIGGFKVNESPAMFCRIKPCTPFSPSDQLWLFRRSLDL